MRRGSTGYLPGRESSAQIGAYAEAAVERAIETNGPILFSTSVPVREVDPLGLFTRAREGGLDTVFWDQPSADITLVGVGALRSLTAGGPGRFQEIADHWHQLTADALLLTNRSGDGTESYTPRPTLLGGFSFTDGDATGPWSDLGEARLILPELLYTKRGRETWAIASTLVSPDDDPGEVTTRLAGHRAYLDTLADPAPSTLAAPRQATPMAEEYPPAEEWLPSVSRIAEAIRAGELEKAVLARTLCLTRSGGFHPQPALRYLRGNFPECYLFAISHAETGTTFLGATPERIVYRQGERAYITSLAGSAPRGSTPAEDDRIANELLHDPKNRLEHQLVLESILEALVPIGEGVEAAPEPTIHRLPNVQHLFTPVTARVGPETGLLDLVDRIHPTPAICGHPTQDALDLIAAEEPFPRGWYAGPIGWIDAEGDGEFVVGLRSALLHDDRATLYAGCGIMGDSDPRSEFDEANLKFRPMLEALGAGGSWR